MRRSAVPKEVVLSNSFDSPRRHRTVVIPLLILALILGGAPLWRAPAAAQTRPIVGNSLTLPPGARVLGRLPTSYPLHLIVGLAIRHADLLRAFLRARTAPGSPLARQTLSTAQFTDLFSPTPDDQRAIIAYLRARGLRVTRTYRDRLMLDVAGTAGQAMAAFNVHLVRYRDRHGSVYYANVEAPRLPTRLASLVTSIVGLRDDAPLRHAPQPQLTGSSSHIGPRAHAKQVPPPAASWLTPSQIQNAYDIAPIYSQVFTSTNGISVTAAITGLGQTIAIYELSPYNPSDIATYDAVFGITATMPVSIAVDGGATDPFGGNGTAEAAMDIELVQALAPGAQILVYNGPATPNGTDNVGADDTYKRIIDDGSAQILSTSWGQCEPDQLHDQPSDIYLLHDLFAEAVARGMTVVAASGDTGANDCVDGRPNPSVDYPASDPYVIGVGGTTLALDGAGNVIGETGWVGNGGSSGGGSSAVWPLPSWQTGPGVPVTATMRQVPDVAMNGGRGYAVWAGGAWSPVNGTSAGPPIWAAILALINQARYVAAAAAQGAPTPLACAVTPGLGDLHAALYGLAASPGSPPALRDITSGASNGVATPGPGWDAVTGLGVPDAYTLLRTLIALPSLAAPAPGPCPTSTPIPPPPSTATPIVPPVQTTPSAAQPTATPSVTTSATAHPSATRTPTPTGTLTRTPVPTATPSPNKKSGLVVVVTPGSIAGGGTITLRLHGAPGPKRTVTFELRYPGVKAQRLSRLTDAHGSTALRVRVPNLRLQGRALVVRLSATIHEGKKTLVGWTSFRVLPLKLPIRQGGQPSAPTGERQAPLESARSSKPAPRNEL